MWGDEANPPLLLIHGNRDHARTWDQVAMRLKDRYCVYAVDLRGHGDSAWAVGGQYSLPEFVLDIAMLGRELNRYPLTIIGHSLGGAVTLEYAGVFPQYVKKVVAIEGLGPRVREPTPGVAAHARLDRATCGSSTSARRAATHRSRTPSRACGRRTRTSREEMAHHLTIHGMRKNDDGSLSWKFDNYVRLHSPYEFNIAEAREIWNQIRCPVLLIRGSESWASDPEADGKASAFHDYRTVLVKDAGHWVHHDQLDKFMGIVWDFLDALSQAMTDSDRPASRPPRRTRRSRVVERAQRSRRRHRADAAPRCDGPPIGHSSRTCMWPLSCAARRGTQRRPVRRRTSRIGGPRHHRLMRQRRDTARAVVERRARSRRRAR